MIFLEMKDSVAIVLTFVALGVIIILGTIFYFLIRRNIRKDKEANDVIVEDALSKKQMENSIKSYIKKVDKFGALSLLYVDIDSFSELKEIFGKEACDELLKEVAGRILRIIPTKSSLCRYYEDQFLIFLKEEDNKQRVEKLASSILDMLSNPFQVMSEESISLTASIGIVSYPRAGLTFDELLNNLELTTYVSKRNGGDRFTNYYASIKSEETDNMKYYKEVKQAIKNGEFDLFYQPICDIKNRLLFGCECLMRWHHPTEGIKNPAEFLKILEQSGDIKWVGTWGLERMIKTHDKLIDKFPTVPLRFSLNLSTKQLLDPNLANDFIDIMKKTNSKPENYMLEITDFRTLEKIAGVRTNIHKLRDYGFNLAVDGFVINGQSVDEIRKSPVDVIKLGRDFVRDIENNFNREKNLEVLVKYAFDNKKLIVSEGIETAEVASYVKSQKVTFGQGYLFSKPISEAELEAFIESRDYQKPLDAIYQYEDEKRLSGKVFDKEQKETNEVKIETKSAEEIKEEIISAAKAEAKEAPEVKKPQVKKDEKDKK